MLNIETAKTSEILAAAREWLWDGGEESRHPWQTPYICFAVERAMGVHVSPFDSHTETVKRARRITDSVTTLMRELCGSKSGDISFNGMLVGLGVPENLVDDDEWLQLRRRELLTNLISHYERMGD